MAERLPMPPRGYDALWMAQFVRLLEQQRIDAETPVAKGYVIGAHVETRSLDPATATLADLLNFTATLAGDLIRAGIIAE